MEEIRVDALEYRRVMDENKRLREKTELQRKRSIEDLLLIDEITRQLEALQKEEA